MSISGLYYYPSVVTPELELELEQVLSAGEWSPVSTGTNSRCVQQYGSVAYGYRGGRADSGVELPPVPELFSELIGLCRSVAHIESPLNQCIVNRYEAGQGIAAHTDLPAYGPSICCFTLGSGAEMEFTQNGSDPVRVYVVPRSLYTMTGECRYDWRHQMRARRSDVVDGRRVQRGTRVSITFRNY